MILLSQSCKTRTLIIPEYRRFVILITAILITRILSLNNANTINSPCNHDFNVSLGIHVQNVGINQISYNLDLKSLIDLRKFFFY